MLNHKVLVRWLPSSSLRMRREVQMGGKWGTEIQQTAIRPRPLDETQTLEEAIQTFSEAYVLSEDIGGFRVLNVGFLGRVKYNGTGWVADGHLMPPASCRDRKLWNKAPSNEELLKYIWDQLDEAQAEIKLEEAKECAALLTELYEEYGQKVAEAYEANKDRHPFWNRELFEEVGIPIIEEETNATRSPQGSVNAGADGVLEGDSAD